LLEWLKQVLKKGDALQVTRIKFYDVRGVRSLNINDDS